MKDLKVGRWTYLIFLSTIIFIYLLTVSLIPVNNNWVLKGFTYQDTKYPKYNYPLTLTVIQASCTFLFLFFYEILKHFLCKHHYSHPHGLNQTQPSWLLDSNISYKLYKIWPAGMLFGLKLGLSNWGLGESSLMIHLLLQSSGIFWTALFARIFIKEIATKLECLAILGSVIGSILISLNFNDLSGTDSSDGSDTSSTILSLVLNLLAPAVGGASIVSLRFATKDLSLNPDNDSPDLSSVGINDEPVSTSHTNNNNNNNNNNPSAPTPESLITNNMSSSELACIKMGITALTALPFAFLLEYLDVAQRYTQSAYPDSLSALSAAPPLLIFLAVGSGSLLTMIFHVDLTVLSIMSTALTVGLVSDVKIIPQTIMALLFDGGSDSSEWNQITGIVIIVLSVAFYAYLRYKSEQAEALEGGEGSRNHFEKSFNPDDSTSIDVIHVQYIMDDPNRLKHPLIH